MEYFPLSTVGVNLSLSRNNSYILIHEFVTSANGYRHIIVRCEGLDVVVHDNSHTGENLVIEEALDELCHFYQVGIPDCEIFFSGRMDHNG